jgi:hypothetical protein
VLGDPAAAQHLGVVLGHPDRPAHVADLHRDPAASEHRAVRVGDSHGA